jgi:hypothetical protein
VSSQSCCSARPRCWGNAGGLATARRSMPRRARLVAAAGRSDAGSSSRPTIPRSPCGIAPFGIRTRDFRDHSISQPYALARVLGRDSIEGLRQHCHRALEQRDLYVGCGLAVELAELLVAMEESEEAVALFFHTIKAAAAAGLYQVFLRGRAGIEHALETSLRPSSSSGVDRSRRSTVCPQPAFAMGRPRCRQSS